METKKKIQVPSWKLRRLVPRALRILDHYKDSIEVLKPFEVSLPAAGKKFVEAYDAARAAGTPRQESIDAEQSLETLNKAIQRWLGLLARDIPNFKADSFVDSLGGPDDASGGAQRLLEIVNAFRDPSGLPLPYLGNLVAKIAPALEQVEKHWELAQAKLASEAELLRQVRAAAVVIQKELIAFRRTLRATLGRNHRDYQLLRVNRTLREDEEQETSATSATPEVNAPAVAINGANKGAFAA